jgi:hypothetical protein
MEMSLANIYGVIDSPEGFVLWAIEEGAVSVMSDDDWDRLRKRHDRLPPESERE